MQRRLLVTPPRSLQPRLFQRRGELDALGVDGKALARRLASGELVRIRQGAYVGGPLWAELSEQDRHRLRARATLDRSDSDAVLSHLSAGLEHGASGWGHDLSKVHLTRLDLRAGRRSAGVVQHRGLLLPEHVVERDGVPVTTPARAVAECTTIGSLEASVVMANELIHRRLLTVEELHDAFVATDSWPGSFDGQLVRRLARPGCESVGESLLFLVWWRYGIPEPQLQVPVRDHTGQIVAYLDEAWPERRVWAEYDGPIKYQKPLRPGMDATQVVVEEKDREDLVRELKGWRCLRFVSADLRRPEATAARMHRALYP